MKRLGWKKLEGGVEEAMEFWSREPGSYVNVSAMLKYGEILRTALASKQGEVERLNAYLDAREQQIFSENGWKNSVSRLVEKRNALQREVEELKEALRVEKNENTKDLNAAVLHRNDNVDLLERIATLETEIAGLREGLAGMIEWFDSEPVRRSLSQAASLTLTHPHLGVKISKEFGVWAREKIERARTALLRGKASK